MMLDPQRSPDNPDHPAEAELRRFMNGTLASAEVPRIVRHLLKGCPHCGTATRRLWALGDERLLPAPPEIATVQQVGIWQ